MALALLIDHRMLLRIAATALTLILLMSAPAKATTIVMMSDEALALGSDAIVAGTVVGLTSTRNDAGGIDTYVTLEPTEVLKGYVPAATVTIREHGGRVGDDEQWLYGNPTYALGESVIVFLRQDESGFLRTNQMALGKFSVAPDADSGELTAARSLDEADVIVMGGAALQSRRPGDRRSAAGFKRHLRDVVKHQPVPAFRAPMAAEAALPSEGEDAEEFKLFNNTRWFEPDSGQPVRFMIDQAGDPKLGFATTQAAMLAAFAAWTNVPTASLVLQSGGTAPAAPFACDGTNRIVFNDPFNQVTDPSGCGGILAIGGYCASGNTKVVNGVTFRQIVEGDITFNNGWGNCGFWNQCNVGEVATHEVGHTIGLAHSTENTATMYAYAHFDGRCASLAPDDAAGVSFIYPQAGGSPTTATPTPTTAPTPAPPDADRDGIADAGDNCPATANPDQSDVDGDGDGDACDNCVAIANPDQIPSDACGLLTLQRMRIRLGTDPSIDDDTLTMAAKLDAGVGTTSVDEIMGQPVTLILSDSDNNPIVELAIPGDAWKVNRRRTALAFRDRTGLLLGGLTRVKLRSRDGVRYHFTATAKNLDLEGSAAPELMITLDMGGRDYVSASGCESNRAATRISCASANGSRLTLAPGQRGVGVPTAPPSSPRVHSLARSSVSC